MSISSFARPRREPGEACAVEQSQSLLALESWAQQVIDKQIEGATKALAAYCKKPRSIKRLHAARKQLARLRAALDDLAVLAGVTAGFRERVDELHRRAGKVRDADTLRRRVAEYGEDAFGREREQVEAVDAALRKKQKKARRKLRRAIADSGAEFRP